MYSIYEKYYIEQYESLLDENNIDTCCFMGYGYNLEDVKVGCTFYFSYLFFSLSTTEHRADKEATLRAIKQHISNSGYFGIQFEFTDKFKLISKYKYFNRYYTDHVKRKSVPIRVRDNYIVIQNLRTKIKYTIPDEFIDRFSFLLMEIW